MSTLTATVEVLTAQVRVLMVGSRQVTLSVYRQLDWADPREMTPFGRIRDEVTERSFRREVDDWGVSRYVQDGGLWAIGCNSTGDLVRSHLPKPPKSVAQARLDRWTLTDDEFAAMTRLWDEWSDLSLVILAGLK